MLGVGEEDLLANYVFKQLLVLGDDVALQPCDLLVEICQKLCHVAIDLPDACVLGREDGFLSSCWIKLLVKLCSLFNQRLYRPYRVDVGLMFEDAVAAKIFETAFAGAHEPNWFVM
jgi:hypothetical protein